jgi:GDPmannose 4,6-dehydratase
VELAFSNIGVRIEWRGSGVEEKGVDAATGTVRVEIDPRYFRPAEVHYLCGDPAKARQVLGWSHTIGFAQLVQDMMEADRKALQSHRSMRK